MTPTCRISVVIPTYQRRDLLLNALRRLERQTFPSEDYEVVIGIDGSTDGTLEMVSGLDVPYRLLWHLQRNRGRAAACNAAVRKAGGDLIVLLDDDMEPVPSFLEAHLGAHATQAPEHARGARRAPEHANHAPEHADRARLGVLGAVPIPIESSSSPVARYVAAKFNRHLETLSQPGYRLKLRDFYSGNFSIPRRLLLEVGGFDEEFDVYGNEDLDLSLRLQHAGVKLVYSPDAVAFQRYTKNFAALARDTSAKGRTAVLLAQKHPAAFGDLKLSTYSDAPLPVRLVRDGLLALSDAWPAFPQVVLRLFAWLEKRRVPPPSALYVHVLGYFYWIGARASMREQEQSRSPSTSESAAIGELLR